MKQTLRFGEEQLTRLVELQNKAYKPSSDIAINEDMSEEERGAIRELKRVQRKERKQAREDMEKLKADMIQWIGSF